MTGRTKAERVAAKNSADRIFILRDVPAAIVVDVDESRIYFKLQVGEIRPVTILPLYSLAGTEGRSHLKTGSEQSCTLRCQEGDSTNLKSGNFWRVCDNGDGVQCIKSAESSPWSTGEALWSHLTAQDALRNESKCKLIDLLGMWNNQVRKALPRGTYCIRRGIVRHVCICEAGPEKFRGDRRAQGSRDCQ